jgi:wobble nucleotide-excising tRNase
MIFVCLLTANEEKWTRDGDMNVRKLRYRIRSYARTVPSKEVENKILADFANATHNIGAVCSVKVMKQKPVYVDQTLTLPSSPPVATL